MSAPIAIRCSEVAVEFERWGQTVAALSDLNLEVTQGEWLLLVGPNGSGKSTLLKALSGRQALRRGQIQLCGQALDKYGPADRAAQIFYVHQNPLLGTAEDLTLFENLWIADPRAKSESKRRLVERYQAILAPLGLGDRLRQEAGTLSGGQRQLLALAIAALRPAEIVLLDEPLAALDPRNAERCLDAITALSFAGKTLLQVTHDLRLAVEVGDRTVGLREGTVVYDSVRDARTFTRLQALWSPPGKEMAG